MHGSGFFGRLDERRIRWLLGAFFAALAVPAALLISQAFDQLKWEAFRSTQLLADDFAARVDGDLRTVVSAEEARTFGDYSFLVVEGDAAANFVQRSPLSAFPVAGSVPGALGYFQVDADGVLTTPLLPPPNVEAAGFGIGADELAARAALFESISEVFAQNRLVPRSANDETDTQSAEPAQSEAARSLEARSQAGGERLEQSDPTSPLAPATPPAARAPEPLLERARDGASNAAPGDAAAPRGGRAAGAQQTQAAFDRLASAPAGVLASSAAPESATPAERTAAEGAPAPERGLDLAEERADTQAVGAAANPALRQKRSEQSFVAEPEVDSDDAAKAVDGGARVDFRVRAFESELDPFEVGVLDTGHLVMFRNVWRGGRRYIQGVLIDRERFVASVGDTFRASSLAAMSDVGITYRGSALGVLRAAGQTSYSPPAAELAGALLHRVRLSPPFGDLALEFRVMQLPPAPGSLLLLWVSLTLAAVLCGGVLLMYRFSVGQVRLARQQQDFVSAVSHELKTPLTSIRMYGEMLKAGWADDAKKQTYYDYIHSESERLSRLIENVLQLARLTRNAQHFERKRATVAELMDLVRSKVATQVARAGFALDVRDDAPAQTEVLIDPDCFTQIVINLVDNALKFSTGAERRVVEIASRRESDGRVLVTVRDFGPGIPKGQMKKIFALFYRPENELTRETAGTGIGLALVQQLAAAMGGRVDVRNCDPGAEFRVSLPPAG
jgi:two-component system phosphate regulon sensor histidine kinase PhoR